MKCDQIIEIIKVAACSLNGWNYAGNIPHGNFLCFSCGCGVIIGDVFDVLSNFQCCLFMTSDMIIAMSSVDMISCLIAV